MSDLFQLPRSSEMKVALADLHNLVERKGHLSLNNGPGGEDKRPEEYEVENLCT